MSTKDGGPAFPCQALQTFHGVPVGFEHSGMTMRDYFAAKALQGLIHSYDTQSRLLARVRGNGRSTGGDGVTRIPNQAMAGEAYALADAMLAERDAQS